MNPEKHGNLFFEGIKVHNGYTMQWTKGALTLGDLYCAQIRDPQSPVHLTNGVIVVLCLGTVMHMGPSLKRWARVQFIWTWAGYTCKGIAQNASSLTAASVNIAVLSKACERTVCRCF